MDRQAGDVATGASETSHQTTANGVRRHREDDRDDPRRLLCCDDRRSGRDNDVNLQPNELSRYFGEALAAPLRPAILDRDGVTLDPAELVQSLHKGGYPWAPG